MDEEETRGDKRGGAKEPLRGQEAVLISMPMVESRFWVYQRLTLPLWQPMSMIVVYMMNNNTYCSLLECKRVSELRVGLGVPENHTENFYTSASLTHKSLY